MPAVPDRVNLAVVPAASPVCRPPDGGCVACCRGRKVGEAALTARLRRQTRLFATIARRPALPGRLALAWHELRARRGLDLLLAVVFVLPGVGPLVRRAARERMACAFLGFDAAGTRPGCLLHPARWAGVDRRRTAAFALLPGFACGDPAYLCPTAIAYATAPPPGRRRFWAAVRGLDWFAYAAAVDRDPFAPATPPGRPKSIAASSRRC